MISVCMASYNGEKFIKAQIGSILMQLGKDDELVISDDGSTDRTVEIIESYGDKRIRLLHHHKNLSIAKIRYSRNFYYTTENFENALRAAKGDFIFLSDQDDIWAENKITECMAVFSDADCIMHNFVPFNTAIEKCRGGITKNLRFQINFG